MSNAPTIDSAPFDGAWILVHPYEGGPVIIGPFITRDQAENYMNSWPDDEDMIDDPYIAPLNDPTTVGVIPA